MRRRAKDLLVGAVPILAVLCSAPVVSGGGARGLEPASRALLELEGRKVYRNACLPCHGVLGDGNGPQARYLKPSPRDFTKGEYMLRSTESGSRPTDQDLFDSITRGMPGTTMPAWPHLTEQQRWSLVYYLQSLSDWFDWNETARPVRTSDRVPSSPESRALGYEVYKELKCADCHGEEGRGDGTNVGEMKEKWPESLVNDLTKAWTYKGGAEAENNFLRFVCGMDGSPMPSFAESFEISPAVQETKYMIEDGEPVEAEQRAEYERAMAEIREKLWHLANYVEFLAKSESGLHYAFLGDTEVTP